MEKLAQEGLGFSDNPTFRKEYQRIVEGARKAGCQKANAIPKVAHVPFIQTSFVAIESRAT